MKNFHTKTVLTIALSLLLLACKEENPLLGEWTLEKTENISDYAFKVARATGNGRIRFESDRVVSGKQSVNINYLVDGNKITVHYVERNIDDTYIIKNDSHFNMEIPKIGTFKYVRAD